MENYGFRSEKTLSWITVITLPRLPTFSDATTSYSCHFTQSGSKTNWNISENRVLITSLLEQAIFTKESYA